MPSTVQPIILTADVERLRRFYTGLLGAEETTRFPDDGPVFYVGLRVGDSDLGLTADAEADTTARPRMLVSVEVKDVDALLEQVEALGGRVLGPPNDMSWGQRVAHVQDPDGNPVNLTQNL